MQIVLQEIKNAGQLQQSICLIVYYAKILVTVPNAIHKFYIVIIQVVTQIVAQTLRHINASQIKIVLKFQLLLQI